MSNEKKLNGAPIAVLGGGAAVKQSRLIVF